MGLFVLTNCCAEKQRTTDVEVSIKPSSGDRENGKTANKDELRKSSKARRSTLKIHAISEEQIKNKEGELPRRKEEADNKVVIPGSVREHSNNSSLKEKNDGSSSEPSPLNVETTDDSTQGLLGSASNSHYPITTPVWFSLVSLPGQ